MSLFSREFRAVGWPQRSAEASTINRSDAGTSSSRGYKTPRDCPRVTLRLAIEDYERLKREAGTTALSTYLRSIVLDEKLPRSRSRSGASVADQHAMAQILGLLGQSRIANNLNQIAYQANTGSLVIDDATRKQIDEAYRHVTFMRKILIRTLGLKG